MINISLHMRFLKRPQVYRNGICSLVLWMYTRTFAVTWGHPEGLTTTLNVFRTSIRFEILCYCFSRILFSYLSRQFSVHVNYDLNYLAIRCKHEHARVSINTQDDSLPNNLKSINGVPLWELKPTSTSAMWWVHLLSWKQAVHHCVHGCVLVLYAKSRKFLI